MKCNWCGKKLSHEEIEKCIYYKKVDWDGTFNFCCEECKTECVKFIEDVEKNQGKFLGMIFGLVGVYMILAITFAVIGSPPFNKINLGVCGTLFGIILIRYPYGTPETNLFLGIKRGIKVIRIMAVGIIIASIVGVGVM